jgi:hypothetical protein
MPVRGPLARLSRLALGSVLNQVVKDQREALAGPLGRAGSASLF